MGAEVPPWIEMTLACRRLAAAPCVMALPHHRLNLIQIRPYYMAQGWSVRPHQHSFYEASIILDGSAQPDFPGGSRLGRGNVYYHGPHATHSWTAPEESCQRLIIWFSVEPTVHLPRPAEWPRSEQILADTLCLLRVLIAAAPGWRDHATARLAAILMQVLEFGEPHAGDDEAPAGDRLAENVDMFLRDNLNRGVQLDDVARCFGLSQSGLTHRYRAESGMSVGQRLVGLRMEQAAQLLTSSNLTLEAIADQVGLTDAAYLCRVFKRYFNMTPTAYRRREARSQSGRAQ